MPSPNLSQGERDKFALCLPGGEDLPSPSLSQGERDKYAGLSRRERDEIALSLLGVRAVGIVIGVKGGDHVF